jgi:hypothetical protein
MTLAGLVHPTLMVGEKSPLRSLRDSECYDRLGPNRAPRSPKILKIRPSAENLVKGVKPSNFFQAADSDGNINLKIWRVYPLEFATPEVEAKKAGAAGNPARAFFIGVKMRKDSRKSREPKWTSAPIVRGNLSGKTKGELGELAFSLKAASLGFGVAKPNGEDEAYDFILDSGEACGECK